MNTIKRLRWFDFVWLFGLPTMLNAMACQIVIPYLDSRDIMPIEVCYFLSVGVLVLAPMFFGALYLTGTEVGSFRIKELFARMRINTMSGSDWVWAAGTFIILSLASFLVAKIIVPRLGLDAAPFFFKNMPLGERHVWILSVWPLFFFLNIFGEELWWRGYIQPRQELLTKKSTWFVHGLGWAFWHVPMGLDLIISATPIFFVLPAVVQYRKNTTIAIVVHTVFGGFGFLALALGAVH